MTTTYEAVIGLEIHAELMTNTKMFCGCRVVDSVEADPNTAVCPVCSGMPGMLPVINRRAVEFALRVALALNCEVQSHNIFARKNYFYPDLPKAYQISQYELPLGLNGWLDVEVAGETRRIGIRRVHMEEDTGKLTHLERGHLERGHLERGHLERGHSQSGHLETGGSLVDYNRSGVPLLEIVSEPDIRSGEEARAYAVAIRQILRYLNVNSGDMEKGVLRVEPNISVRPAGSQTFGTRTELKNLNSFRSLAEGTAYEIERQIGILNAGGQIVQETRGWHEGRRETFSQRTKEEAEDYRYFPEPDLPPLHIAPEWVEAIRTSLPELPQSKAARYMADWGLSAYEAGVVTEERAVAEWLETAVAAGGDPKTVVNWLINNLFSLMNEHKQSIEAIKVTPAGLVDLIKLVDDATISHSAAKTVLAEMYSRGATAETIVAAKGLAQISDADALSQIINQTLVDNPDQVQAYRDGKTTLKGWFVGQVMKATRGKANPALVNQLLNQALSDPQ